ncbi:MAG: hypothetical protein NTX45_05970 [Proteobacteria bacterium]|nr:hypothetical protein [Pseudomonadota bacterium]
MAIKLSLLNADPIHFSPIYVNTENVSTDKLLSLYRFANIFFPAMGSNLVNTMLDMEKNSERIIANCPPQERRKLIHRMKDMSVDLQFMVNHEGENVIEISIHIVPSDVLEQAQQGRDDLVQFKKLSADLDKIISKMIAKEISRRFASKVTDRFKSFIGVNQAPSFVTQLLGMGWINPKGQLQKGASIDDLLTGKYHEQFEELMPKELLQEGMLIRETLETYFSISQDDDESLFQDAQNRHALLEITIRETKKMDS